MMARIETPTAGLLDVRIGGVLRHEDYMQVETWIDEAAAESPSGKADLVFEFDGIKGITPRAMLDDAKLGLFTANREVRRMAIVAEGRWMDVVAKMFNPISRYELKHFGLGEREAAQAWACDG